MSDSDTAKKIVSKILNKSADITKEIPAGGSTDLFGNNIEPEQATKVSDKDLFGQVKAVDKKDRDAAQLPPEKTNSDSNKETSDTEDLAQGYSTNSNKTDDVYTGSGDGPKL